VDVLVHWDPVTPRDAAARILRSAFDLVGEEAAHAVLMTETNGDAFLGRMPMRTAVRHLDRASAAMRRDGLPIRFSFRRP
jgi:hypothetical protein